MYEGKGKDWLDGLVLRWMDRWRERCRRCAVRFRRGEANDCLFAARVFGDEVGIMSWEGYWCRGEGMNVMT